MYYRMRKRTCEREAEARKRRLNNGSSRVAEMRGVAGWPSTAEIGESERFRVQRPIQPYSTQHFLLDPAHRRNVSSQRDLHTHTTHISPKRHDKRTHAPHPSSPRRATHTPPSTNSQARTPSSHPH